MPGDHLMFLALAIVVVSIAFAAISSARRDQQTAARETASTTRECQGHTCCHSCHHH